jgi:Tfp pilus assembly PilM family ATPase
MVERAVGLSFDGGEVRAVEVVGSSKNQYTIERMGSVPLTEGAMEAGAIVDEDAVVVAIEQLWKETGFTSHRVRLAIDGRLAVLRRTELPVRKSTELREAASYDIAELVNYSVADAVFGAVEIDRFERDDTAWMNVLVASVAGPTITQFHHVLRRAGLRPVADELFADALVSALKPPAVGSGHSLA